MKLGLLAYPSPTGLGYQTKAIYDHLKPTKTLVVDLSQYNRMPVNYDWYPTNRMIFKGIPNRDALEWLVHDMDAVFVCETPLNYYLYDYAKKRRVKTIQQPNPEFLDFFRHPSWTKPDYLGLPSIWMKREIKNLRTGAKIIDLPVPVDRKIFPFRQIINLKTIIHIIGRPAVHDRNGTLAFLEAIERIGNKYKYIIYKQTPKDRRAKKYHQPIIDAINETKKSINIEVIEDVENYVDLYSKGDLLVLPRRYGGLCMPMQEALSCGIPVIMTNISPNYDKLPSEWLCDSIYKGEFFAHTHVKYFDADIDSLVEKIENLDIIKANEQADDIAKSISWTVMRPTYQSIFNE